MANIRINELPADAAPNPADVVALDGATTRKSTLEQIVNSGRPLANQAEAEAGTDPTKSMSPLATAQAIAAQGAGLFASASQGTTADSALQPSAIGTTVQAHDGALDTLAALALAQGDILYATGPNAVARLAIGSAGFGLISTGTVPQWNSSGGVGMLASTYDPQNRASDVFNQSSADIRFLQTGTGAVTTTVEAKLRGWATPEEFGAVGNGASGSDGAINSASSTFTSATAAFVVGDIGKKFTVRGAGAAGIALITTIAGWTNSTTVTLTNAASTTVTVAEYAYGTDDLIAWQRALATGKVISAAHGVKYYVSGSIGSPASNADIGINGATILACYEQTYPVALAYTESLFYITAATDVRIHDGVLKYFGTFNIASGAPYGGVVDGIFADNAAHNFRATRIEASGFNHAGIGIANLSGNYVNGAIIENCYLHHNRVSGAMFGNTERLIVANSRCHFNGLDGDFSTGYGTAGNTDRQPRFTLIVGNDCSYNIRKGVDFHAGDTGIIANNMCVGNQVMGIYIDGSTANPIKGDWSVIGNMVTGMTDAKLALGLFGIMVGQSSNDPVSPPARTFNVTGNTVANITNSHATWPCYGIYLNANTPTTSSYNIGNNIVRMGVCTSVFTTNTSGANVWWDLLLTDNQFYADECKSNPALIAGAFRDVLISGNYWNITTCGITTGMFSRGTSTASTPSFKVIGETVICPATVWSAILRQEPFIILNDAAHIMSDNIVNGVKWREWDGYRYVSLASAKPSTGWKRIGDIVINTTAPGGGVPRQWRAITTGTGQVLGTDWIADYDAQPEITVLAADFAGADVSTAQPLFGTAADALTVAASTTYRFVAEIFITRAAGVTSHTMGILFGGTATLTSIGYLAQVTNPTGNALANVQQIRGAAATLTTLTAANTSATENLLIRVEGVIRVNGAGTLIPQFQFSAAPGGAPSVKANTFFEMRPIGPDTMTKSGAWA